jgi:phosphoribosyl-ATP pyrophosphohydrolase/phosphoribosyl-AMP cyclohydrolase
MYKNMIEKIDWSKCNNLIPAIIQDAKTLEVLMLGFMNKEALKFTQEINKVHFWSRTKNRIWMKGEESGNILNVIDIKLDCDEDSLLILVEPVGNTCHNGTKSCFNVRTNFLAELEEIIEDRIKNPKDNSYASKLSQNGINKVAQKVGEEATEVVIAALSETNEQLTGESADLLFHLLMTLKMRRLGLNDVIELLKQRNEKYEK